ncbi:MAG: undecaprenyldiphospho-muramoylpentapeptide beta-N-acetylglucosaminyltransferase [Clostridiaceae bacterium]|nr:undecaprenyldiphospho-muramoylpentapeptide beta-N-acetylglucosaminyltransferase [Clostridiaceae bacterium]
MSEPQQDKKVYFITGGGTGGHIYPAVAVADELSKDTNNKVFYIGNPENMEYGIVTEKGYEFLPIKIKGMPRSIGFGLIGWAFQLLFATIKAAKYIKKYKPNAVFGTGGYVSAPTLIACALFKNLKTPYMMHDCDAKPGLVTRKLAPFAKAVSLAFDCAKDSINNKNAFIFGNPIREEFKILTKQEARKVFSLEDKMTICVMGGSQGAQSINNATVDILKKLSDKDIQVIFQTGKKNFDKTINVLLKAYPHYAEDKRLIVRPYFKNMAAVLKASDIVISRSGSLSLSEICAAPAAAILIPYPYAASDHQRKNAKYLTQKNAALYIDDDDLNSDILYNKILSLVTDPNRLKTITDNAQSLANYNATSDIASKLKSIC